MIEKIENEINELLSKQKSIETKKEVRTAVRVIRLTILESDLFFFKSFSCYIPLEKFWENGIVQLERDLGAIWIEREDDDLSIIYNALVFRKPMSTEEDLGRPGSDSNIDILKSSPNYIGG